MSDDDGLLEYACEGVPWHEDWPEARPSNWDEYPRIVEDPLDVPPWYDHRRGRLLHSWRGYGYCRPCRWRVEARTEDEARALLAAHVCPTPEPYFVPRKQRARKLGTRKNPTRARLPKVERHVEVCGECFVRFESTDRQAVAQALKEHVQGAPCDRYAHLSERERMTRAWQDEYCAEADRRAKKDSPSLDE